MSRFTSAPRFHRMVTRRFVAPAALACPALALSGCMVGPKYQRPPAIAPTAVSYPSAAATNAAGVPEDAATWKPAAPSDAMLRGKWWQIFQDAQLNALEDQLDINNQNIKQAFQQFMAARALIREARASLFPQANIGPAFNRNKASGNLTNATAITGTGGTTGGGTGTGGGTTTGVVTNQGRQSTLWSAPLDISWEPDLWGRIRSTIRSDEYQAQLSAADLENERLTEQAALAEAYFELRGEDALQQVLNTLVAADRDSLKLTQAQYETGIADHLSVVQAQTTLQTAEAAAIAIAGPRATYEHAIATLIGRPATDFQLAPGKASMAPPPIPLGVPSQLLERRPDIAAAERSMASANALIGVATAAFYPTLTLTADGGFESSTFKHWFDWPSRFWSTGPAFSQPVYDAGLRRSTVHQYIATYNADVAAYRETVLTAFQQVEDYLAEVRIDSEENAKQREATASAQEYLNLALDRYRTGLDPYLNVITAQNTLLADQQSLFTSQITTMTAAVELVQALGGGWNAGDLPTPKQVYQKPTGAETTITR